MNYDEIRFDELNCGQSMIYINILEIQFDDRSQSIQQNCKELRF